MSRKRPARSGNPDLRRATQLLSPPIAEIEALLWHWLTPSSFKPSRLTSPDKKLRDGVPPRKLRFLTLPVTIAVVLSLVYRRISGDREVVRILESEGLLWQDPLKASKQARSKRLACLPAELFGPVFELTIAKIRASADRLPIPVGWESVRQSFNAVWIASGSTLEALRKKLKADLDSSLGCGLYHFSRFLLRGETKDVITYLVEHHKMLGLIKQERKRHRERAAFDRDIWESTA